MTDTPDTLPPETQAVDDAVHGDPAPAYTDTLISLAPAQLATRLRAEFPTEFLEANPALTQLLTLTANTLEHAEVVIPVGDPETVAATEELLGVARNGEATAIAFVAVRRNGDVMLFHTGSRFTALGGGIDALRKILDQKILAMHNHVPSIAEKVDLQQAALVDLAALLKETSKRLDTIRGL